MSAIDGHNCACSYPLMVLNLDGRFPASASFDTAGGATSGRIDYPDGVANWTVLARAHDASLSRAFGAVVAKYVGAC